VLKLQSAYAPMDFLAGTGEMARRIQTHDWYNHPFGPAETWPQSLRSALSICLNSAFATAIYWGPELRLLYNDAWAPIPGPRHPEALGARAEDIWHDIWHIIEPQFAELIQSGEGLVVEDQLLPMRRFGFEEETYWSYSFTPLRAEDGRIVGIFNSGSETTARVIQNRHAAFLITLNEDLRSCEKASDALDLAVSRLGGLLKAVRVGIRERTNLNDRKAFTLTSEWCAEGYAPSAQRMDLSHFVVEQIEKLMSGKIVQLSLSDPGLPSIGRRFLIHSGISGLLAIPWTENGQVVAVIYIHTDQARAYDALHVSTVEKVFEITMGWIDRERHREREKVMAAEIDHRARNMLAVIQSIIRMTAGANVDDVKAKLADRLTALSRVHSLLGRKRWTNLEFRDLLEDELAPLGAEIYERVSLSGAQLMLSAQEAQLIAMILHELTTNALKYGSLREATGRLSVTWSVDGHRTMTLDWIETGTVAISQQSPERSKGGFGSILLSNIIQLQLGGEVQKTLTEEGISYRFLLPLDHRASAVSGQGEVETGDVTRENSALSVMVVEDDAIISLDITELLSSEGHTVFGQFRDIETALDALRKGAPDVALLDADLGGDSSAPIAEALNAQSIPFIVVSGHGNDFAPDDPRAAAPRIEKPISNKELISFVESASKER